ncbi:5-hydroxyisourate hydrolase-like isoform X2 [Dreissena polymorpha]|uniref:5-hydroxyisourate hydrolase-like isoform X2 n=1 Tax=Dreissena polymorpha TaxID=45954 RepID=UPI0022645158|nr:5-hydroxyisourate hydrolase-like isoform X2 [Dreissena polymorpha]
MSTPQKRIQVTAGHINTIDLNKTLTMADTVPPLTTHVLDTSNGLPAANVAMVLYIQNAQNAFDLVEKGKTNNDGRGGFLRGSKWQPGVYKLHFDTDGYFRNQNTSGFYPYVEVVFRIVDPSQHYHVPLLLSPFGYSTYRGS